ncbi:MAG TPA: hypothetical protein VGG72_08995 [Bryobacteraceae bacterium]|jgi:hypothetical protein
MERQLARISLVVLCGLALAACAQGPNQAEAAPQQSGVKAAATTKTKDDADNWTRFNDPYEQAFGIDIPAGWKVQGGLVRRGAVDFSLFLRALSPDDSILLILGDPAPAVFGTPGFGAGPKAKPYMPGQEFARQYVEQSLPEFCSGLTFISGENRQDIATGPLAQATPYAKHDAGDVTYSCMHNGKPTHAFMAAGTYLYASQFRGMPGTWGTFLLAGCMAPAERIDASKKMVLHMLQSARFNPEWTKMEQGLVDQATRNINAITAAQQRAFDSNLANAKAQQAAMRGEYNAFNNVQTQTGTFVDPAGHQYSNVQNTQNYHWISTGGKIAETSGPTPPPGTGWTQLRQVPAK